jgi:hypothetical protein
MAKFFKTTCSALVLTLVTVGNKGVDIANLRMSGIFDKTGHVPLNGDDVCFESAACDKQ